MSLIDQPTFRPFVDTAKEAAVAFYGLFFPMSTQAKIVCALLAVILLWGVAIFTFGVPGLVYPMMLVVPGMILSLVLLTWGM